ncbi:MAG TPA: dockerin type I repeat-containing protein [Phycisphaerae bacterium]|nr:dockerin type I repeat-containing protein [Phycisphaerae bacterium]
MRRAGWVLATLGFLTIAGSASAYTIMAGITLDVHQDIQDPALWPNDFHIEGWICTRNDVLPLLNSHLDGLFPNFAYAFGPLVNGWYSFTADWWLTPGSPGFPYCTMMHFGLLFDVQDENTVIKLTGWWTKNGQRVGLPYGNNGFVPVIGFSVAPIDGNQAVRITNGTVQPPPILPPPPPIVPEPGPIDLFVNELEIMSVPPGFLPPDWFQQLKEGGAQQTWPWVNVVNSSGNDINPGNPIHMGIDSFFDIFTELSIVPPGHFRPSVPVTINPGDMFFVRTKRMFINNSGQPEPHGGLWEWHIHQAQGPEACCFPDGHCEILTPIDCSARGGFPQGAGTTCNPNPCIARGACCFGTTPPQCVEVDQLTCQQQFNGQWKGPGTTCADLDGDGVADICETAQLGACCYGTAAPLCVVTDQITCQMQFLGQWMGPGTTCADLDGDGIADVCEPPEPQACCLPNGTCIMLPPDVCVRQGGTPKGPGSRCLGDLNENGIDDICEAKWYQLPDLTTTGIDILASQPLVLADDFLCNQRTLITDIRIWGSWDNDILPPGGPADVAFTLSIHGDIPDPDGTGPLYSMPGPPLWTRTFPPGSFQVLAFATQIDEGWWDPRMPTYQFPGDHVCWEYRFAIPASDAFCQEGSPETPLVYWLDVQAFPSAGPALAQFGWKTSINHWNDHAVWGMGNEPYPGPWNELQYPMQHPLHGRPLDLAFALAGDLPCPSSCPTCRGDTNGDNMRNGLDVECFIDCLLGGTIPPYCNCACADMNKDGAVDLIDVPIFVNALLYKTGICR